jgi:hypothetical protein
MGHKRTSRRKTERRPRGGLSEIASGDQAVSFHLLQLLFDLLSAALQRLISQPIRARSRLEVGTGRRKVMDSFALKETSTANSIPKKISFGGVNLKTS